MFYIGYMLNVDVLDNIRLNIILLALNTLGLIIKINFIAFFSFCFLNMATREFKIAYVA